jgi:hypothetical protein
MADSEIHSTLPSGLRAVFGPRIPHAELSRRLVRYATPSVLLGVAAVALIVSIFLPYWGLTLHAPQYPKGLRVHAYLTRMTGDVDEIDELNHYIGMRRLGEAARLERSLSGIAVTVIALLVVSAVFIHTRFAAYLSLPALAFPVIFLADLQFWLWHFGTHLDRRAPLSQAIKPFVPPVLGKGFVGQFGTVSAPEAGLLLATAASLTIAVGLFFHWRAYSPLVERERRAGSRR